MRGFHHHAARSPALLGVTRVATPFIIINGESNAAGYADNAGLSAGELAARSNVQILNNTGLVFENLDIGTNANIGQGLTNSEHGLEAGIANCVYAKRFANPAAPIYLMKSSQSGSTIASWDVGQTNWTNFTTRLAAAQSALASTAYVPYIVFWLGLNDALAGTATATFKAAVIAHFAKMRALIGANTKIIIVKFGHQIADYPLALAADYNTAFDEIAAGDPNTVTVSTIDIGTTYSRDSLHLAAQGMRMIAERVVDEMMLAPAGEAPTASPAAGSYGSVQSVTFSAPDSDVYYVTDTNTPTTGSTLASGSVSVAATATYKTLGVRTNRRNSSVSSHAYTISIANAWSSTDKSSNITLSNSDLDAVSGGGAGFNTVIGNTSYSSGKRYFEVKIVGYDGTNQNFLLVGIAGGKPGNYNTYVGTAGNPGVSLQFPGSRLINTFTAGTATSSTGVLNRVVGVAVDMDAGKVWLGFDNVYNIASNGADPGTGTNPWATFTAGTTIYPAIGLYQNNPTNKWRLLTGGSLTYSPPSGFTSW